MVEMKSVYRAEDLSKVEGFTLPVVFLEFLSLFFSKIRDVFGIPIFFQVENPFKALEVDNQTLRTLSFLKEKEILTDVFHEHDSLPDEPRLFSVATVGKDNVKKVTRSLLSYSDALKLAIKNSVADWCFINFDVSVKARKLFSAKDCEMGLDLVSADSKFECVEAQELTNGISTYVPLQFFSHRHYIRTTERNYEPALILGEVAIGLNKDEANFNGILHAITRVTSVSSIGEDSKLIPLDFLSAPLGPKIDKLFKRYNFQGYFWLRNINLPIFTVQLMLVDNSNHEPKIISGFASGLALEDCMYRSLLNALEIRLSTRDRNYYYKDLPGRVIGLIHDDETVLKYPMKQELSKDFIIKKREAIKAHASNDLLEALKKGGCQIFSKIISPDQLARSNGWVVVMTKVCGLDRFLSTQLPVSAKS